MSSSSSTASQEDICNNINELTTQQSLDCESRPIISTIMIILIFILILLKLSSSYIKDWLSSWQDSKQQNVQDEEVGLLETAPV